MTEPVPILIGDRWLQPDSEQSSPVHRPATGEVIAQTPHCTSGDVDRAVAAAQAAFPAWSRTPAPDRARVLFNYRELLEANFEELAGSICRENGKTREEARGDVRRGIEVVELACGIGHLAKGEVLPELASGIDGMATREPVGVCAGITPFNFPAMVPMWMFPVAIACGNTFVLKPSERDPSCSLRMAELMCEAGAPDGVLNVVNGDKEAVDTLLVDPTVQAVSFVGSTAVGEHIYKTGCAHGKRVQALCGAKNHLVVMPDADMGQVVDAVMGAAYGSAGERCMAVSVVVAVGDDTADRMLEQLTPRVEALKVGSYSQAETEMGPVITPDARDRIKGYIDQGLAEGADLIVDGRDICVAGFENGCFVGATIFDRVSPKMKIYTDEIFGPVLSVVRAGSYEEAVELVNEHEYGNGTAIFTRDGDAARDFTHRVRIGMVGVNVPIPVPLAFHSFGGWKRSLFGDHYIHGPEGVRFYTRMKTVTSRWPSGIREGAVYNFKAGGEH